MKQSNWKMKFYMNEYWDIMKKIEEASAKDVDSLATALNIFGIMELSNVAKQAQKRIEFLGHLNQLISNPKTLEKEMHIALENNLWIFGIKYSMKASNETLKNLISNYCQQKFKGSRANKRPDLLLANDILNNYLIIEFKRPSKYIKFIQSLDLLSEAQRVWLQHIIPIRRQKILEWFGKEEENYE